MLQITPRFPPDVSGVGDYAALLGQRLSNPDLRIRTLVAAPEDGRIPERSDASTLPVNDAGTLVTALAETDTVLLHFSGYGYARRGLCNWLSDGLDQWKQADPTRRLVTLFHEVHATGPVWRSSFWTAAPQRRIAGHLARLSDATFCTSADGIRKLRIAFPAAEPKLLPVFSNIGEPDLIRPISERSGVAVVFGGPGRRQRVYCTIAKQEPSVARILARQGIERILDIGPRVSCPDAVGPIAIEALGALPASDLSRMLSDVRIGLIDYPGRVLTKSGIAAAYLAHGLLVLNTCSEGGYPPGFADGRQFATLGRLAKDDLNADVVASAGHVWYRAHDLKTLVDLVRPALMNVQETASTDA